MPHDPVPNCCGALPKSWKRNLRACRSMGWRPEQSPTRTETRSLESWKPWRTGWGDNYPYFHPLYAGQMLKPPHPLARVAYALAMKVNPNNHARDGRRTLAQRWRLRRFARLPRCLAGRISRSLDFKRNASQPGSSVGGGPVGAGKRIVGSEQAHYTHRRFPRIEARVHRNRS